MLNESTPVTAASLADTLLAEGKSLFMGSDAQGPIFGLAEDHLLVIGPPRSGKTSGLLAPTIACHPGPVVVASIRHDLVTDTSFARNRIAERFGGKVIEVQIPGTSVLDAGAPGWSISDGCSNWNTAKDRAVSLAYTAVPPSNGDTFWRESVATALAGCLHGAALLGHSDLQLAANIRSANLDAYRNSIKVFDQDGTHPSTHSFAWHYDDRVMADNTRKSLLAVLSGQVLGAFDYDQGPAGTSLNVSEFVRGWGTVYITVPYERKDVLSPLVSAFVESVISTWRQKKRMDPETPGTLLLALDEVANIAPLPSLPGVVTTGAGDCIQTVLALQSPAQANVWSSQSDTILTGTSHVAIFPGLRAHDYVRSIAEASEKAVAYTPVVTVAEALPTGDRYATAERLVQERKFIEGHLAAHSEDPPRRAGLRAARQLAALRRQDHVRTRSDDASTAHNVLDEIMRYTDVRLDVERRLGVEPSDITLRAKGELTLVSGTKAHFLKVEPWAKSPFWHPLMTTS